MERMTVRELKERLDRGEKLVLVDVREPWEHALVAIEDSRLIPMGELPKHLSELNPADEIVMICHTGRRSAQMAQFLERNRYSRVYNLEGGVDAWAREIDPSKATY